MRYTCACVFPCSTFGFLLPFVSPLESRPPFHSLALEDHIKFNYFLFYVTTFGTFPRSDISFPSTESSSHNPRLAREEFVEWRPQSYRLERFIELFLPVPLQR
jgi:hypothetical protein